MQFVADDIALPNVAKPSAGVNESKPCASDVSPRWSVDRIHETTFPFTLRIAGGVSVNSCPATEESFDMRGSVDSLGRMKGTTQRREVGNDYYDGPFSWTATFELEGVVRQKGIQ